MKLWTPNQPLQNGRFIIQKVLGGGGFGITYSAIEQRTGKIFVLKTLNHIQQSQADFEERQVKFVKEAFRLVQCTHPHIVKVHDVINEDGLWGMVMEYIDGQDLGIYVDERGQLPEDEALHYIHQVGQALEYVHQQGFLHRDVKPSNILLRQSTKEAVLIDFGLAREFTLGKTGSMTNSKTEGYAPIEQYERRGNFAQSTDVYALAATLYTLLSAEVPFPANFRKYAQLPPPKHHNPHISVRVNDGIMTGMALEMQDRPQVFVVGIEVELESIKIPNFFSATVNIHNVNQHPTQPPNFLEYVKRLLGLAEAGDKNLIAIRGYSIIQLLGKGGFGEVYLAQHNQTKNFVAMKVMLPAVAANDWAIQMFLRETENTKALRHPHVVKLLDYGYSESIFFFTMEYCEGGTVEDLMQRQGGRLSVDIAIPIILQVLNGLEYAHNAEIPNVKLGNSGFGKGRGLVHRDLKPSNIFLCNVDGKLTAKIGDYGLAKAFDLAGLSGQTLTGTKAGTPVLMCRQQLLNYKYAQPEVDVWAAAACLYNMLTGTFPRNFTGGDPFLMVLQNDSVPIRQRDASIPQKLAEAIDLALVEKPEIYFKSATEFKQALLSVV